MRKWIGMAAILASFAAAASPRSALVAAGRCDDSDLLEQSKELSTALRAQIGEQLVERDELSRRLGFSTSRLPAELERQLEGAELQFFEADYAKADQRVLDALQEVERLPPGAKRWQLFVRSVLLRALILRVTGRLGKAEEQFHRILRLDPDHRLNSDYFSPSTRAQFDRVRRRLAGAPRASLVVTSSPPGAQMYVDGLALQRTTPSSLELLPGRYAISLSNGDGFSFVRSIELPSSSSVHFDLEFESSLQLRAMPCLADRGDEQLRLTNAVKLGSWLGIERVVIVRVEPRSASYIWISASLVLVATGQKIREGGVKVEALEGSSTALVELAEFISTGKAGRHIVASDFLPISSPVETLTAEPMLSSSASGSMRERSRLGASTADGAPRKWSNVLGTALVGAGTLAVATGMVFQLRSDQGRAALNRYYSEGRAPPVAELGAVQSIRRRADSQRGLAILGYALGAAAISTGAVLILTRSVSHDSDPAVSLHALPGSVWLGGRWH